MSTSLFQALEGKRFGITLSAGFFGFYGHTGFLKGLQEAGLSPRAYSGTSAGGLVAGFAAAGMPPGDLEKLLLSQSKSSFWDPDPIGAMIDAARGGHRPSGLLKGDRFLKLLEEHLPQKTFETCIHPLLLVAANLSKGTAEVFYEGPLALRMLATCAYPGLFRAIDIGGELFWDGGLVDKAPVLALAESAQGQKLEAMVVHYLPSRGASRAPTGALAYPQGMAQGVAALRRDHFRLQVELLKSRGMPVYVVESNLPKVSPSNMEAGAQASEAARQRIHSVLQEPALASQ